MASATVASPKVSTRTATGAVWMIGSRLSSRVLDFAALFVLARILSPPDFGLVALAMSVIYIVEAVLELPLNQALVQLHRITPDHLNTAFTLGLLRGIFVAASVAALAVPFAHLYRDPRLFLLITALSLAPAARGLVSPGVALFSREGSFSRDFIFETGGKIAATVVSIGLAIFTRSYWALAAGTICGPVAMAILSYIVAPAPIRLSLKEWRDFAGFFTWTTGAQVLVAVNWQADRLVMGRVLPTATVGRYSMASDLGYLPDQVLLKPMARPIISGFVKVRHDIARLRAAYSKVNHTIATLTLPLIVTIAGLSNPLLRMALGEKWVETAPLLTVLALSAVGSMLAAPLNSLALALGKPSYLVRRNLAECAVKLPMLVVGISLFGVTGALVARVVSSAVVALTSMLLVRQLIGRGVARQMFDIWRPVVAMVPMGTIYLLALPRLAAGKGLWLILSTGCVGAMGILAYGAVLLLLAALWGRSSGTPEETVLRLLRRGVLRAADQR